MGLNELSAEEADIIVHKGTERPFSGKYNDLFQPGLYICRRCNVPLYYSKDKFKSDCGWPSFDDEIKGAVKRIPDTDGIRTEITCAKCNAHLGHVFTGEHLTKKNVRHCVNSISMKFIPKEELKTVVFGGGCFWCIESAFRIVDGVVAVISGYAGGQTKNPTYEEVSTGKTGHAEVVEVVYYSERISLEKLLNIFFSIHDPTSINRQGNDSGTQYRSLIIYSEAAQKKIIDEYIDRLQKTLTKLIVTETRKLDVFYTAEDYHQSYFEKNPLHPYCLLTIPPKLDKVKKIMEK